MPSEFVIIRDGDGSKVDKIGIDSYINNLDRTKHEELYGIIDNAFGKMVPLFDIIN